MRMLVLICLLSVLAGEVAHARTITFGPNKGEEIVDYEDIIKDFERQKIGLLGELSEQTKKTNASLEAIEQQLEMNNKIMLKLIQTLQQQTQTLRQSVAPVEE